MVRHEAVDEHNRAARAMLDIVDIDSPYIHLHVRPSG
jgi:hypothetical protein